MDNNFQDNQGDNSGQQMGGGNQQFQGGSSQGYTGGGQQFHDDAKQPEQVNAPALQPEPAQYAQPVSTEPVLNKEEDKKEELPEISEEELSQFDMNSFDPTLKPDLTKLSDDSLGKALGSQAAQYGDGAQMTAQQQYEDIVNTPMPANNLQFDGHLFLELLAGSISLMYTEKKAIIGQIPKLSQFQIDELFKILKEEKKKFAQLNKKHQEELKKIEEKHSNPEEKKQLEQEETAQKSKDQLEAEELLRKLQGN